LLVAGFIQYVEEATWLSPIVVLPKKNSKQKICIDFIKLNAATKKDPYPLPFTYKVLNTIVKYETFFLRWIFKISSNFIGQEDRYKTLDCKTTTTTTTIYIYIYIYYKILL
jgi:hypothetical protein